MCANWVFYFLSVYLRYSGWGLDFVDFKATAERPKPTYCDWRSGNIKACKSGLRWVLDLQRFRYMTQSAHYTMREPRLCNNMMQLNAQLRRVFQGRNICFHLAGKKRKNSPWWMKQTFWPVFNCFNHSRFHYQTSLVNGCLGFVAVRLYTPHLALQEHFQTGKSLVFLQSITSYDALDGLILCWRRDWWWGMYSVTKVFFFCKLLLRKYRGVLHQAKACAKERERSLLIASVNHANRSALLSRDIVGRVRCFFVTNHKSLGLIRHDLCSECWVSDLIPCNRL